MFSELLMLLKMMMVMMVKYDSANSCAGCSSKDRSHLKTTKPLQKTPEPRNKHGPGTIVQGHTLRLQSQCHIGLPSQPPQHPSTLKEKERPGHFRLLPYVGAEKFARAIEHTAVARNRAALATFLLVDTLADKQVAACIHDSNYRFNILLAILSSNPSCRRFLQRMQPSLTRSANPLVLLEGHIVGSSDHHHHHCKIEGQELAKTTTMF